jgi:hypothetical protein
MDVCAHGDVEHHPGRYFGQGKRKVEYCRRPVTCTLAEDYLLQKISQYFAAALPHPTAASLFPASLSLAP